MRHQRHQQGLALAAAIGLGISAVSACGGGSGSDGSGSGGDVSASSGGGENGGSPGVGGTADASGGSGGSGVPRAGESCDQEARLACDAMNDRARLLCTQGEWSVDEVCGATEVCDLRAESATYGLCVARDEECDGYSSGDSFCDDEVAKTCAGAGLLETSEVCALGCDGGECGTFRDNCGEGDHHMDCTGECTGGGAPICDDDCHTSFTAAEPGAYELRIPDAGDSCVNLCGRLSWHATVTDGVTGDRVMRVSVSPDWGIATLESCDSEVEFPSCRVLNTESFTLVAKSEQSVARNVLIEVVDGPVECGEE